MGQSLIRLFRILYDAKQIVPIVLQVFVSFNYMFPALLGEANRHAVD